MASIKKKTTVVTDRAKIVPGEISEKRQTAPKAAPKQAVKPEIKVPMKNVAKKMAKPAEDKPVETPVEIQENDNLKKTTESTKAAGSITYQKSAMVLERDAEPNEIFGIGDSMPIYYF